MLIKIKLKALRKEKVILMPLNYQNQLSVLKDILSEHQSDCCGTVSECEQMERLAKSMLANAQTKEEVKKTLENIYYYSQTGKGSSELNQYIQTNQANLTQWMDELHTLS